MGVFVEVGGTSTNICVIKDGKPEIRYVMIMQHPTCIRSLDVRVAGVAGGSLVRWSGRKVTDVGPRSAHIAGLPYSCFASPEELEGGQIITFSPKQGDPIDYVAIESEGKRFAIANICAANALGIVPENDYARANQESARASLSILASRLGTTMEQAAGTVLEVASKKVIEIIEPMIKEYKLNRNRLVFIGGGGGASVLVPYIARKMQFESKIAEHAEVISSIGVAAAMIHEEVEKTINDPRAEDISTLVEEVKKVALDKGALPESITIQSEYISERSLHRVTAMDNVSLDIGTANAPIINNDEAYVLACELFGVSEGVQRIFSMKNYHIFACEMSKKKLFLKSKKQPVLVLDKYGRIRLSVDDAVIFNGTPEDVAHKVEVMLHGHKESGNDLAPQIHILDGLKLMDFSSLTAPEHVSKAVRDELLKAAAKDVAAIIKLG